MTLTDLFDQAAQRSASDIHLATGEAPRLRVAGSLVSLGTPTDLHDLLGPFLTSEAAIRLAAGLPFERTIVQGDQAFVGIAFRTGDHGMAATFRILGKGIPPLEKIAEGALPLFRRIAEPPRGLVLVVGPTGSGKWTTVCSVVETINLEKPARIFVVGNHPSYRFESKQSMVTELHVGQDCDSYDRALSIAGQADLDVVALDDIPTLETLRSALTLAATGHLVIANLHAVTPVEAIERLIESAGAEADPLRRALSENLVAVTAQRLLPGVEGGRAPAYEWIVNTPSIRKALLNGGLAEAQASDPECQTLTASLDALVASGRVSEDAASLHRP
jgi:Tfp pilus assembly pilus retraction ATPase PilT